MHIGQDALDRSIEQLRRTQAESGVSLETAMHHLTDAVIKMFGLSGAGLMLLDDDQLVRSVLATDDLGWALESAQEQAEEGPCVDSVVHGQLVATADVATDVRWPRLADALRDTSVHAVLGVPVRLAGSTVGALNVYVDRKHDWDESDRHALQAFGEVLETLLASALFAEQRDVVVEQLQSALESRVLIERSVGLLMGREGISAVAAFNRLRDMARPSRRKVQDIARELLDEQG